MGLLEHLKKVFRAPRIDDPFFGSLRGQGHGVWEGKRRFAPLGAEIEVIIDAGESGPGEGEREFFRQLEAKYPELEPRIAGLLEREIARWEGKPLAGRVWDEFAIESIEVPRSGPADPEWEIVYPSKSTEHYFCVPMRGWEPGKVRVDG
jgi:hypothetical protein